MITGNKSNKRKKAINDDDEPVLITVLLFNI